MRYLLQRCSKSPTHPCVVVLLSWNKMRIWYWTSTVTVPTLWHGNGDFVFHSLAYYCNEKQCEVAAATGEN